jgi:nitrate reductase gamma subunit
MDVVIDFLRGPLFRFSIAVVILGLSRHVVLSVVGFWRARSRAGHKQIDFGSVLVRTVSTLNPMRYMLGGRWFYTVLSVLFHVGVILVPLLFLGHIRLWERGIGISWPALPTVATDILTWLTIITGIGLLLGRGLFKDSREMSRRQDWVLPPLIVFAFVTGYLLAHPGSNPLDLKVTMLVHVSISNLLLLITPFTKIAHCVMLPFSQLVAEMAWRLVPGAGTDVVKTLGKEGEPI